MGYLYQNGTLRWGPHFPGFKKLQRCSLHEQYRVGTVGLSVDFPVGNPWGTPGKACAWYYGMVLRRTVGECGDSVGGGSFTS